MKPLNIKHIIIFSFLIFFSFSALGQDISLEKCDLFLKPGYVSDGQEYIAKLDENNVATFYTTFYGGSHYRVIGCTDISSIPLILNVYDTEKNLLFSNKDHDYTNYWNFTFKSTIDCIIEIKFDVEKRIHDEVMLLIGFKEK